MPLSLAPWCGYTRPMKTFKLEPITAKLRREISVSALLRHVEEEGRKRLEAEGDHPGEIPIPDEVIGLVTQSTTVVQAAFALLEHSAFAGLARRYEQQEEEYMSGGPPMSPLYDSYSLMHVIAEIPQGVADETPLSVLARLLESSPAHADLHHMARDMAESLLDLYRVTSVDGPRSQLVHVRSGQPLTVLTSGPFLRDGDLFLGRVFTARDGRRFISHSPYLLQSSEQEWRQYFERVLQRQASSDSAGVAEKAAKKQKRTKKDGQGPRRQDDPGRTLRRHLQRGDNWRTWPEYIVEGYVGNRNGIVRLAGVPDRPETLPHNEAYERPRISAPDDATPLERLRVKLMELADSSGRMAHARESICEELGVGQISDLTQGSQYLFLAQCMYGALDGKGRTALDEYAASDAVRADEKPDIAALQRGWFSLFRVERVELNEGFVVMDALRRKRLRILDRSATRSLSVGMVLAGWIMQDVAGTTRLEGAVITLPWLAQDGIIDASKEALDALRREYRELSATQRLGMLPCFIIVATEKARSHLALPELQNTSGDRIVFSKTRYRVRDQRVVVEMLERQFQRESSAGDMDSNDQKTKTRTYSWLSEDDTLYGTLTLSGGVLAVSTNSVERLKELKERLESQLGAALAPGLDSFEGEAALREKLTNEGPGAPPMELSKEMKVAIAEQIGRRLMKTLDEPIAKFSGKTLRQLARGKKSRADAVNWLREQERMFRANPQLDEVDLRPLWRELGLEYQGID